MQIALEAPERIDRLVLACTAARFATPESWDARIALVRAGRDGRGRRRGAAALVHAGASPTWNASARCSSRSSPETYVRYCELLRDLDLRGALGAIEAPTLAIAGAEDPTTPPARARVAGRRAPAREPRRARARAAHLANVERPQEFNAALLEHLAA